MGRQRLGQADLRQRRDVGQHRAPQRPAERLGQIDLERCALDRLERAQRALQRGDRGGVERGRAGRVEGAQVARERVERGGVRVRAQPRAQRGERIAQQRGAAQHQHARVDQPRREPPRLFGRRVQARAERGRELVHRQAVRAGRAHPAHRVVEPQVDRVVAPHRHRRGRDALRALREVQVEAVAALDDQIVGHRDGAGEHRRIVRAGAQHRVGPLHVGPGPGAALRRRAQRERSLAAELDRADSGEQAERRAARRHAQGVAQRAQRRALVLERPPRAPIGQRRVQGRRGEPDRGVGCGRSRQHVAHRGERIRRGVERARRRCRQRGYASDDDRVVETEIERLHYPRRRRVTTGDYRLGGLHLSTPPVTHRCRCVFAAVLR